MDSLLSSTSKLNMYIAIALIAGLVAVLAVAFYYDIQLSNGQERCRYDTSRDSIRDGRCDRDRESIHYNLCKQSNDAIQSDWALFDLG